MDEDDTIPDPPEDPDTLQEIPIVEEVTAPVETDQVATGPGSGVCAPGGS